MDAFDEPDITTICPLTRLGKLIDYGGILILFIETADYLENG